jgi:hypothetical protein
MTEEKRPSPWITGVVDTLVGARVICGTKIPHRNRLAVILMDTAFETACRAFLKHKKKITLNEGHRNRDNLVKTVRGNLKDIDDAVWDSIDYYYQEIRNDLYHQSAGKTITDSSLLDYQDTVEFVIGRALDISVAPMVVFEVEKLRASESISTPELGTVLTPKLRGVTDRVEKVIVGIATVKPQSVGVLNEFFKREGDSLRLKPAEFTNIVARNTGSKRFFYYSKEHKNWGLSSAGQFKLSQIGSTEET